jgi:hypothetical protein
LWSDLGSAAKVGTFVSECNGHYFFGFPLIEMPRRIQQYWFYADSRLARAPRTSVPEFDKAVVYIADIPEYRDVLYLLHGRANLREARHQICADKAACSIVSYEGAPSDWPKSRVLREVSVPVAAGANAQCKHCVPLGEGGLIVWTREPWPRPLRGLALQLKGGGQLEVTVHLSPEESVSTRIDMGGGAERGLQRYEVLFPAVLHKTWAIEVRSVAAGGDAAVVLGSMAPLF